MTVCNLCDLELGLPGVSSAMGTALTEAGIFCLESQNHKSNTDLILDGNYGNKKICLVWDKEVTNQIKKTWADTQEATEFGACGIAIMLVLHVTDYTVIERSKKLTGFDYWLGDKNEKLPFINSARLEVSGILNGNENISKRVNQKLKQTDPSDNTCLPAVVVVVEFGTPTAHMVEKWKK